MLFILIGIYFAKTCITFCAPSLSLNLLKLACECEVRTSSCRDTYAPRCCYEINYSIAPRMHPDSSNEIKLDPDINFPRIIAYFPFTHFPICLRPRFVFWRNDLIIAARSTKKDSREFFFLQETCHRWCELAIVHKRSATVFYFQCRQKRNWERSSSNGLRFLERFPAETSR